MLLRVGTDVLLGSDYFKIIRSLGGGAVADVYLAQWSGENKYDVIIKIIRDDYKNIPLQEDQERLLKAVHAEAETLQRLNLTEDSQWPVNAGILEKLIYADKTRHKRKIIALYQFGNIDGLPYLIQEFAPKEFRPFEVHDIRGELKMLCVALGVAQVIQIAHSQKIALKDFEPYTKGDRIRVDWLEKNDFDLKIIDWNISGSLLDDFKTDLVYFGCHLYRFFVGENLPLGSDDEFLPEKLDIFPAWSKSINEGTRLILQGLLSHIPANRYESIDHVVDDLSWWIGVLMRTLDISNPVQFIMGQIKDAFVNQRFDHMLALAHLALDRYLESLSELESKEFHEQIRIARENIEKQYRLVLVTARQAYYMQSYEKAAQEYADHIKELPAEILLTREACAEMLLAQAKSILTKQSSPTGIDVALDQKLESIKTYLSESNWHSAIGLIDDLPEMQPVNLMKKWSEFELILTQTKMNASKHPSIVDTPDAWLEDSNELVRRFDHDLTKARIIADYLAFAPWIPGELSVLQSSLDQRLSQKNKIQDFLDQIKVFDQKLTESKFVDRKITAGSVERAIAEIKKNLSVIEDILKNINGSEAVIAQIITVTSLEQQPWLVAHKEKLQELRIKYIDDGNWWLGALKEHEKLWDLMCSARDLLGKDESAHEQLKLSKFEHYTDVKSLLEEIEANLKKFDLVREELKKSALYIQPLEDTGSRDFESASNILASIGNSLPSIYKEAKEQLQGFIDVVSPGYPEENSRPTGDDYLRYTDLIFKLDMGLEKIKGFNAVLGVDFSWKRTSAEETWYLAATHFKIENETRLEREKIWWSLVSRIDQYLIDLINENRVFAHGQETLDSVRAKVPEKKIAFTKDDFDDWDKKIPLSAYNETWGKYIKYPIYYVFSIQFKLLRDDKKNQCITDKAFRILCDAYSEKYMSFIKNTPLHFSDIEEMDLFINASAFILSKSQFAMEFSQHKNFYENQYRVLLQKMLDDDFAVLDEDDQSLQKLISLESSGFYFIYLQTLKDFADKILIYLSSNIKNTQIEDFGGIKNINTTFYQWKDWLSKHCDIGDIDQLERLYDEKIFLGIQFKINNLVKSLVGTDVQFIDVINQVNVLIEQVPSLYKPALVVEVDENTIQFIQSRVDKFVENLVDSNVLFTDVLDQAISLVEQAPLSFKSGDRLKKPQNLVASLTVAASLEQNSFELPPRHSNEYIQNIKEIISQRNEADKKLGELYKDMDEVSKEKLRLRCDQLLKFFDRAINAQVDDLLSQLDKISDRPEVDGVTELFNQAFNSEIPSDFSEIIVSLSKKTIMNLHSRLFLEALPNLENARALAGLEVISSLASLSSKKDLPVFDLADVLQQLNERVEMTPVGGKYPQIISSDGVLLSKIIQEAITLMNILEKLEISKTLEKWPFEGSTLHNLIVDNYTLDQILDARFDKINDTIQQQPVQALQNLNRLLQIRTPYPDTIEQHLRSDWRKELNYNSGKIRENIDKQMEILYFQISKSIDMVEKFYVYFIQPVSSKDTLEHVEIILYKIWEKQQKEYLSLTISEIDNFRIALRKSINDTKLGMSWKDCDRSLLWLRWKLWLKLHWVLLLVLFILFAVMAFAFLKLPLIFYIIDILHKYSFGGLQTHQTF